MSAEKPDETKTYVLDETAITQAKTIEELAELAAREIERQAGGTRRRKQERNEPSDE
ncbi:MAG TPA: hypothetical protein VFV10_19925 [Gammaproteobacteria bacterium]|nr:hypothetical protein [Gammaproteobacteria bacterium]